MNLPALGSCWKHKKKGKVYRVADIKGDMVYLKALSKGARSTWKYAGLLEFDYIAVQVVS